MHSSDTDTGQPPTGTLQDQQAAILVADNFQVHEAYYPYFRLREAGVEVFFVGAEQGKIYRDYYGEPLMSTLDVGAALDRSFDYLHIPGGFAPMKMRAHPKMVELANTHYTAGRLLGAICHAGSFLVTMDILKGRRATSFFTLKDDLINAGADYVDDAPVVDGHLITARTPDDLPVFMEAVVRYLGSGPQMALSDATSPPLQGKTVAILVEPRYQLHQVWYPYYRLQAAGAEVRIVGTKEKRVCKSRVSRLDLKCDLSVRQAAEVPFDAVIVPGDWAADRMRTNQAYLDLVAHQLQNDRIVVSIAEGHSVLISAGILQGRQVCGLPEMLKDIENCGAQWADRPVMQDRNLITARDSEELPELMRGVLEALTSR
ncbi:MAG: DJ-1/PfpI family protein [Fidelibacterota bacterium]|nr:MAG: DJ-1/PfpI family protein [Candidatus Neomarinimicrobiota bacterium]